METKLCIPQVLRKYSGGLTELTVAGSSIAEVLANLEAEYPALYGCICDETRKLRPHINLFLNRELVSEGPRFSKSLSSGDVISVFQAVSGG